MIRAFSTLLLAVLFCLPAAAEEVSTRHQGRTLKALLEQADGRSLNDGVILMVHGTLAHGRMEIMSALQDNLKARGFSSLAINLSFNVDRRPFAMHDCKRPQTHTNADAVGEIAAWVDWLKAKGVGKITLLGHSRGANQVAWYASERRDPAVKAAVLIAPGAWTASDLAQDYEKRFGKPLAPLLAKARQLVKQGQGKALMPKVDVIYCQDTRAAAETFLSYHAPEPRLDAYAALGKAPLPFLVVAGSADEVVRGVEEKARPHADGKRVHLITIEGADHFFRDLYAEEAADAIAAFLKEQGF